MLSLPTGTEASARLYVRHRPIYLADTIEPFNGRARILVGLMLGVAAQVVRAKVNGWIANAKWGQISGWWQGAGSFVTRG
jgi:hypothetical protein